MSSMHPEQRISVETLERREEVRPKMNEGELTESLLPSTPPPRHG
jgi:hypothetical protein